MKVKISTATAWEGTRREAGSVIEVPVETYELNSTWMKPTDEPVKDATATDEPVKDATAPKAGERQSDTA